MQLGIETRRKMVKAGFALEEMLGVLAEVRASDDPFFRDGLQKLLQGENRMPVQEILDLYKLYSAVNKHYQKEHLRVLEGYFVGRTPHFWDLTHAEAMLLAQATVLWPSVLTHISSPNSAQKNIMQERLQRLTQNPNTIKLAFLLRNTLNTRPWVESVLSGNERVAEGKIFGVTEQEARQALRYNDRELQMYIFARHHLALPHANAGKFACPKCNSKTAQV